MTKEELLAAMKVAAQGNEEALALIAFAETSFCETPLVLGENPTDTPVLGGLLEETQVALSTVPYLLAGTHVPGQGLTGYRRVAIAPDLVSMEEKRSCVLVTECSSQPFWFGLSALASTYAARGFVNEGQDAHEFEVDSLEASLIDRATNNMLAVLSEDAKGDPPNPDLSERIGRAVLEELAGAFGAPMTTFDQSARERTVRRAMVHRLMPSEAQETYLERRLRHLAH